MAQNNQLDHFEFQEEVSHPQRPIKNKNKPIEKQQYEYPQQRKIYICENNHIGINVEDQVNRLQKFFEQKLLQENISKAVVGTFLRKNLISEGEFKIDAAMKDAQQKSKIFADKMGSWFADSLINNPSLREFEAYKKKNEQSKVAKIESIMKWTAKIAEKLQENKMLQIKREFEQSLKTKMIKVEERKEYTKSIYKLKFIKQKIGLNGKEVENMRKLVDGDGDGRFE